MEKSEVTGKVAGGNRIGRELGFPTANVPLTPDDTIHDGVYAAIVEVDGTEYRAMVNVGTRPSVQVGAARVLEAHLFDFAGDLYGREITVRPEHRIRGERKFPTLAELRAQIEADKEEVLRYFGAR